MRIIDAVPRPPNAVFFKTDADALVAAEEMLRTNCRAIATFSMLRSLGPPQLDAKRVPMAVGHVLQSLARIDDWDGVVDTLASALLAETCPSAALVSAMLERALWSDSTCEKTLEYHALEAVRRGAWDAALHELGSQRYAWGARDSRFGVWSLVNALAVPAGACEPGERTLRPGATPMVCAVLERYLSSGDLSSELNEMVSDKRLAMRDTAVRLAHLVTDVPGGNYCANIIATALMLPPCPAELYDSVVDAVAEIVRADPRVGASSRTPSLWDTICATPAPFGTDVVLRTVELDLHIAHGVHKQTAAWSPRAARVLLAVKRALAPPKCIDRLVAGACLAARCVARCMRLEAAGREWPLHLSRADPAQAGDRRDMVPQELNAALQALRDASLPGVCATIEEALQVIRMYT